MNEDEIRNSIELLRARRQSLGELRDYKPQRSGKTKATKEAVRETEDVFGDLIQPAEPEGGVPCDPA
jgi:hypothetical protein